MTQEEIFAQAIELSPGEQADFLDRVYRDQPRELAKMKAMLRAHQQSDSLLDTSAFSGETLVEERAEKPQQIGDFEILRELGRGGMGVVYEAKQKSLKRKVALKVLSSGLGLSSKAILRFRREAEAAGKLHHTNIVPIYTTGEDRGIHYYAMELIDGPSMDAVIKDLRQQNCCEVSKAEPDDLPSWVRETALYQQSPNAPRSEGLLESESAESKNGHEFSAENQHAPADSPASAQFMSSSQKLHANSTASSTRSYFDIVATMIADVADALDHAHEHGVIHRDVKPSNLLLAPDGRLSINDFGLARMLEQPGMTITGEFVGSPLYMSPEQITAGRAPLDHRTDIYSLGATLYELLTLQPPFPGETRDQVIGQILHKEPKSPRQLNRKVPIDLDTICMKAIERDPDRRYQTAGQLANDLRAYVNRHAISARRIGIIGRTVKMLRRNPLLAAMIALVIFGAAFSSAGIWIAAEREREQRQLYEDQARLHEIEKIEQELLDELFRGIRDKADERIRAARSFQASEDWLEFHLGLKELFRQDYPEAKLHFERVLVNNPDDIAARALLAIAYMWGGDEFEYFKRLPEIGSTPTDSFRDNLYLGYALTWGDSPTAHVLLTRAEAQRPGLQYVRFLRGCAARACASLVYIDAHEKRKFIDSATDDIVSSTAMLPPTPLVLREKTILWLNRANIYQSLVSSELLVDSSEFEREVQSARQSALELYSALHDAKDKADAQYAAVMLVSQLKGRDEILALSEDWRDKKVPVSGYAAHFLAMRLATVQEYMEAKHWLGKISGGHGRDLRSVEYFVELCDPEREKSIRELKREMQGYLQQKLDTTETQYVTFDVLLLNLLGDHDAMEYYDDDQLDSLILAGEGYRPLSEYFAVRPESRSLHAAEEMLQKCRKTPAPNASLMHAHFGLGIEALSKRQWEDAKFYLQKCMNGQEFMFTVYFLSELLLAHEHKWEAWHLERNQ